MTLTDIRLLVTDVDGCWTDCAVWVDIDGNETMRYSKRDGVLLPAMREAGVEVVALTSEASRDHVTNDGRTIRIAPRNPHAWRAEKLGIPLHVCKPDEKLAALLSICEHEANITEDGTGIHHGPPVPLSHVAYLGDDLPDLPCLQAVERAGGAACIPYGSKVQGHEPTVRHVVSAGGEGALRDVCEIILRAKGYDLSRWPVRR